MTHRLAISLATIREALAGQFAAAERLMKPNTSYFRTISVEGDSLVVTWDEIPEVPRKEMVPLVSSKW